MNPFTWPSKLIDWIHRHRPTNAGRYVMPYLVVVMTLLLAVNLWQSTEARTEATQAQQLADQARELARLNQQLTEQSRAVTATLRRSLVRSCESNGNPLREGVQDILRREIRTLKSTPPRFFPNIPIKLFRRAIRQQVREARAIARRIAPIDCGAQFKGISLHIPATP